MQLAIVDQTREALPNDKTVFDAISGGQDILTVGKFEMPARAYLGRFNFKGGDQQKIVGQLSGGERGRLHLAATLLRGGNVLLLDEPSNDLDVETLRALEDALLEFAGSALVISHDRWFLDRIATHILAFEGDSRVVFFEGNYQEYEADKKKRLGEDAARPRRIRYKALMAEMVAELARQPSFVLEDRVDLRGVGFAFRRCHDLTDERVEGLSLPALYLGGDGGIGREHVVDEFFDGALVGNLREARSRRSMRIRLHLRRPTSHRIHPWRSCLKSCCR